MRRRCASSRVNSARQVERRLGRYDFPSGDGVDGNVAHRQPADKRAVAKQPPVLGHGVVPRGPPLDDAETEGTLDAVAVVEVEEPGAGQLAGADDGGRPVPVRAATDDLAFQASKYLHSPGVGDSARLVRRRGRRS